VDNMKNSHQILQLTIQYYAATLTVITRVHREVQEGRQLLLKEI
jgi:hypothetical protein